MLLQALDLEEEEWEQFADGIAHLAQQRERKPKDFEAFQVSGVCLCQHISLVCCTQSSLHIQEGHTGLTAVLHIASTVWSCTPAVVVTAR